MLKLVCVLGLIVAAIGQDQSNELTADDDDDQKVSNGLLNVILKAYDKTALPVKVTSEKVFVTVGLEPIFIRQFDEKNQMLIFDAFLHMRWKDDHLKWNPDSYQRTEKLAVASSKVWTPDITTMIALANGKSILSPDSKVLLHSSGEIVWAPLLTLNAYCPMNASQYSENIQMCHLHLYPQAYDSSLVNLTVLAMDDQLERFQDKNNKWTLLSLLGQELSLNLSCCPADPYSAIKYDVEVKRRGVAPSDIVDRLSYLAVFMALLMFWLPPDSLHKVLLGVLSEILLTLGVFYLSTTMPSDDAVQNSTATRLYLLMYMVAAAIFAEVLIINIARMMVHCRPSRCFLGIAKCCCQPFCICASRAYTGQDQRFALPGDKSKRQSPTAQDEWNVIATAGDRLLFLTAVLVCVYFYKFL